ncbi:MAG: hypothetical protein M3Q06_09935, partial [Bacteroidota bacterium]|nr:hypothetical protein [Bacteroidota bacterium]
RTMVSNWNGTYMRVANYHVKGTPHFFGESFWGSLDYKGGESVTGIKVLYNLYEQTVGIDMKNNGDVFLAEKPLERFTIELPEKFSGKKLLFANSSSFGLTGKTEYFNVLEDGPKVAFLKAYRVRLLPDPTNEMNKELRVFDQYYEYYIYNKATKELKKIKLKEKDILKEIAADENLKVKIKSGEVDLSSEMHVISVLKAYNSNP